MGPKEFTDYLRASAETDAMKNVASEMNQNDNSECPLMDCESTWPDQVKPPHRADGSPFHYKDGSKVPNILIWKYTYLDITNFYSNFTHYAIFFSKLSLISFAFLFLFFICSKYTRKNTPIFPTSKLIWLKLSS